MKLFDFIMGLSKHFKEKPNEEYHVIFRIGNKIFNIDRVEHVYKSHEKWAIYVELKENEDD